MPIVASLDYHTNMTPAMVAHASAMVGYRTYPHIDMAATGGRAASLLDRLLRERRPLYKAYRQIDFLIPLVFQCTDAEPARGVFALIDEIERGGSAASPGGSHNQGIVAITHTPGFPQADIANAGPALVVYGYDRETAEAAADRIAAAIQAREAEFAERIYEPDEAVAEALRLASGAAKPVVLADIQDNPGAGGSSDTVGLLRALIAAKAEGAVIGMIVDPEAAALAAEAGEGALLDCGVGAKVGFAGETPVEAEWRVVRLGSRRLHRHRPDVWRRPFQYRPDGAGEGRGERRLGGARRQAHPGRRPGNVPPCRGRAGTSADPRAQIDRAFPRRFRADRRGDPVRARPRRGDLGPGRTAVPQSATRRPPAPARPAAPLTRR